MKHLRLLSFLSFLIVQQALWAGPRTYQQAQAIAEKLAAQMGISITSEAKARSFGSVSPSKSSETVTAQPYYIFPYGEGRGYAIVSGDDQMPEIVAYSDKGTFQEEKMAEGCRAFLDAYKLMVEALAKGENFALKTVAEKKRLMADNNYQQPTVEPLLGDIMWGQSEPFDKMCPFNEQLQKKCLSGCVATAMAQVMRYWKYPDVLKADLPAYTSYYKEISNERYEIPQIDKGEAYDWENMLPYYDNSEDDGYTQLQADAVAKLMLHCGAAVNMTYGTNGSAATLDPHVFAKYFGYDPDMLCLAFRDAFAFKEWCQLIDRELVAKRPVLYAAANSQGGHQFVCDGADGKGFYHINWGWNGTSDGFYDISVLSPSYLGKGSSSATNGFNNIARMVVGLQPDNGKKDEPLITLGKLLSLPTNRSLEITQASRTSESETFTLHYQACYGNYERAPFSGLVNVAIKDAPGHLQPIAESQSLTDMPAFDGHTDHRRNVSFSISYAFPVGTSELYDIYSTDGGKSWHQCVSFENVKPLELEATDTHLSLVDESLKLQTSITTENMVYLKTGHINYTISNGNKHDYLGELQIYVSREKTLPAAPTLNDYADIEAGGSITHGFTVNNNKMDNLYVWIYAVRNDKMLVDAQLVTVEENEEVKFKLLSKSINVKEGVMERDNAYFYGQPAILPVVDGDEAVVRYELQNNGPTYTGSLPLDVMAFGNGEFSFDNLIAKTCTLEGNGAITQLEYRFRMSDLNKSLPSFACSLASSALGQIDYTSIPKSQVEMLDSYPLPLNDDMLAGYFSYDPTSVSTITAAFDGLRLSAGKGTLSIRTDKAQMVCIYNMAGQMVRSLSLGAGITTSVSLPSGVYVIGKQKVMVR